MKSNRSPGRCIRCESMTRSYIGEKDLNGWVMCKHCSKAVEVMEAISDSVVESVRDLDL